MVKSKFILFIFVFFFFFFLFPQKARADELKFVVAGHIYPIVRYDKGFNVLINQINSLKPDAVFLLGDSLHPADEEGWRGFKEKLADLEMPYYLAPGNHDFRHKQQLWQQNVGDVHQSIVLNNYKFILLNTNPLEGKYDLSDEEINFLKKELDDYKNYQQVFLMLHHELWLYPYVNWQENIYPIIKAKIEAVFGGNGSSFFYSQSEDQEIKYFLTGFPFQKNYKRKPTFFLVTAEDENLDVQPILLNLPADDPYYKVDLPEKKNIFEWLKDYFQGLPERVYLFGPLLLKSLIVTSFLAGILSFKIYLLMQPFLFKTIKQLAKKLFLFFQKRKH